MRDGSACSSGSKWLSFFKCLLSLLVFSLLLMMCCIVRRYSVRLFILECRPKRRRAHEHQAPIWHLCVLMCFRALSGGVWGAPQCCVQDHSVPTQSAQYLGLSSVIYRIFVLVNIDRLIKGLSSVFFLHVPLISHRRLRCDIDDLLFKFPFSLRTCWGEGNITTLLTDLSLNFPWRGCVAQLQLS